MTCKCREHKSVDSVLDAEIERMERKLASVDPLGDPSGYHSVLGTLERLAVLKKQFEKKTDWVFPNEYLTWHGDKNIAY